MKPWPNGWEDIVAEKVNEIPLPERTQITAEEVDEFLSTILYVTLFDLPIQKILKQMLMQA